MNKEDKQLLLEDLCGRLPYGVIGQCEIDASYDTSFDTIFQSHKFDAVVYGLKEDLLLVTPLIEDNDEQEFANEEVADGVDILDFKPYLRPMSNMTQEESNELESITFPLMEKDWDGNENPACIRWIDVPKYMDFILSHHFDYQGLIPMGLAIEVTEDNNPYKKEGEE